MRKVLVTDRVHPILLQGLTEMNFQVIYDPKIIYSDVGKLIPELHGIIINTRTPMRRKYIELGANLQFVARLGSGLDIIDVDYAKMKNVHVISAPEGNANAVAEHSIAMILALMHKITIGNEIVSNLGWMREYCRGKELSSMTVGIIGVGNNGTKIIERLESLAGKVIYYDKYKHHFDKSIRYAYETSLQEVLEQSDIISLHIPLTEETTQMIDTAWLDRCKTGVIIVNTSRGKIIVLEDLIESLLKGKVGGACLDVLPHEKPEQWTMSYQNKIRKLSSLDQVILSPHVAGWTTESFKKISEVILKKLNNLLK